MTPAETIAAEVSARYGVPACPTVVRFLPLGAQSIPYDAPPTWAAQRRMEYANAAKAKAVPKLGMHKAPDEADDAYLRRAVAAGATLRQIGDALGMSAPAALKRVRKAGLVMQRGQAKCA